MLCSEYDFAAGDDNMCTEDQFSCILTGECIPYSWVCDDENDCSDASDENDCTGKNVKYVTQRFYISYPISPFHTLILIYKKHSIASTYIQVLPLERRGKNETERYWLGRSESSTSMRESQRICLFKR